MSIGTVLLIVLLVLLLGSGPYVGWHQMGWGPSGGIGLILLIVVVLVLFGRF